MMRLRLKSKVIHSLKGMLVESLYSAFLILLTLFMAIFFHLLLS
jgi:hypothetical protein